MDQPLRKKSTSSDSELSDSWSVVDEPPPYSSCVVTPYQCSPDLTCTDIVPVTDQMRTTDSDGDSVDIIESDSDTGLVAMDSVMTFKDSVAENHDKNKDNWLIKQMSSQYLESSHSRALLKNWFKVITVFSVLCLLVIASSIAMITFQGNLFALKLFEDSSKHSFQENALLEQLELFKKENEKLRAEILQLRMEMNEARSHSLPLYTKEDNDLNWEIDMAVISLGSDEVKPLEGDHKQSSGNTESFEVPQSFDQNSSPPTSVFDIHREKLIQLKNMVNNVTSTTAKPRMLGSWKNIHNYLQNIESIVSHVDSNKNEFPEQGNAVKKIQNKLSKFVDNVGYDFEKTIEKISKRISNFHNDLLSKVCVLGKTNLGDLGCYNSKIPPANVHYEKVQKEPKKSESGIPINTANDHIFANDINKESVPSEMNYKAGIMESKDRKRYKRSTKKDLKDEIERPVFIGRPGDLNKPPVTKSKKRVLSPDDQPVTIDKKGSNSKSKETISKFNKYFKLDKPCSKKQGCPSTIPKDLKTEYGRMKYKNHNGSFHHKLDNKYSLVDGDGLWYLDIGESRARKRSINSKSDWLFDRYRSRRAHRELH